MLNSQGQIKYTYWDNNKKEWVALWMPQKLKCDIYNFCGTFSSYDSRKLPICNCLRGFKAKESRRME